MAEPQETPLTPECEGDLENQMAECESESIEGSGDSSSEDEHMVNIMPVKVEPTENLFKMEGVPNPTQSGSLEFISRSDIKDEPSDGVCARGSDFRNGGEDYPERKSAVGQKRLGIPDQLGGAVKQRKAAYTELMSQQHNLAHNSTELQTEMGSTMAKLATTLDRLAATLKAVSALDIPADLVANSTPN